MHRYPAPFRPDLRSPEYTRHFDDDIPAEVCVWSFTPIDGDSTIAQPLVPANDAPPDATRDPLLRDKVHGQ